MTQELLLETSLNPTPERGSEPVDLYHVSGWGALKELDVGDGFRLEPGPQHAQGKGVYFSENMPRFSAAEGSYVTDGSNKMQNPQAVVHIIGGTKSEGWFISKTRFSEKYNKPMTRHTNGRIIELTITAKELVQDEHGQYTVLHCDYSLRDTVA